MVKKEACVSTVCTPDRLGEEKNSSCRSTISQTKKVQRGTIKLRDEALLFAGYQDRSEASAQT